MFNMGANHRVGPRRINVKLAHALAANGVSSLRFDLGGIGDSRPLKTSPDQQTRAVHCLQAAMDVAERTMGVRRFVISAMCSGVNQSLAAAVEDPRVVGLSLFDGFSFPERRARLERNLRRVLAAPWHPAFRGKTARWLKRRFLQDKERLPLAGSVPKELPPEENLVWVDDKLRRLVERNVAIQVLYSASLIVSDRGVDQLGPLARKPYAHALQYHFLPEVDHAVCTTKGQQIFAQTVGHWVTQRCFGADAGRQEQHQRVAAGEVGILHGLGNALA